MARAWSQRNTVMDSPPAINLRKMPPSTGFLAHAGVVFIARQHHVEREDERPAFLERIKLQSSNRVVITEPRRGRRFQLPEPCPKPFQTGRPGRRHGSA